MSVEKFLIVDSGSLINLFTAGGREALDTLASVATVF